MLQYIVQPGDTLYFIGLKFKTSVETLMEINHIYDQHMIYPGQLLNIPLPFSAAGSTGSFPQIMNGSSGPFVVLLQSQLFKLGYYKGDMDGVFGPTTEGSLVQFQKSRNLPPTGCADVSTWQQLLDDTRAVQDAPPYQSVMVMSGVLLVLSSDKAIYSPGEKISMTLMKTNLSEKTVVFNYNTSQRYDFKIAYPSGRAMWRWSDDKSFTQALGTLSLSPGQSVRYTEHFVLPKIQTDGIYHIVGWNTAKQINHIKLHIIIKTTS